MSINELLQFLLQLGILLTSGSVLPLVVSLVTQSHWPSWIKQTIQVGLSIIVGVVGYVVQNDWHFTSVNELLLSVLAVVTASQIAYRGLWSKGVAPALSSTTDRSGTAVPK